MKCDKCEKAVQELHTKSEYMDLSLTPKERKVQKLELENKWLCKRCWNKVTIKHNLPQYEIIDE